MKMFLGTGMALVLLPLMSLAQEQSRYHVTKEAGPWMVLATSYKGDHAKHLAEQHVIELRSKYRLPGYTVPVDLIKKRWGVKDDDWVKVSPRISEERKFRTYNEWAVIVGGYKDRDDALKTLAYMRQRVPSPKLTDPLGRPIQPTKIHTWERTDLSDPNNPKKIKYKDEKTVNPYQNAFVTRNPMLPKEVAKKSDKPDPFLKKLNDGEEFSLLKSRKKWTLVIMNLPGAAQVKENVTGTLLEKIGIGDGNAKLMNANAMQANEFAKFLRRYKMKAYVLHTRNSSLVTVGEFDDPNSEECRRTQEKLARLRLGGLQVALPMMPRPMPMKVPEF